MLPELDATQTAATVRKFFRHDWPHYLNRAGTTPADLKSPSFENSQEHKMMVILEAQTVIACVMDTLRRCSKRG